jgi:uncharacterized protein
MHKTAKSIIKELNLKKHPEGGYFSEIYRSDEMMKKNHLPKRFKDDRHFSTSIYFLLTNKDFSSFHRLQADEVWHFYSGTPLIIYILQNSGKLKKINLGKNHLYQTVIHAGQWFAAEVSKPDSYSLVGCTVSPGFDFRDFEMAERDILTELYPKQKSLIKRLTIK